MQDRLEKNNEEFLLSRRKFLLSSIAAMGLASMAPMLSIARAAQPEESRGMLISTLIEDVKTIEMVSYSVVHIATVTKIAQKNKNKIIRNNTYVIRRLSPQLFEPLVSITYAEKTNVFAYADDNEFIAENVDEWNDLLVIKSILNMARKNGMRKLERYLTLIEKAVVEA